MWSPTAQPVPDMLSLLCRRGHEQHHREECHIHLGQGRPSHAEWVSRDVDTRDGVERATGLLSDVDSNSQALFY